MQTELQTCKSGSPPELFDFMSELGKRFNKEEQPKIDLDKFARLKSAFETLAE